VAVRLPLVRGSQVTVVNAADDAVVLRPPAPRDPVADVAGAVRDALRFPLSGPPLEALAVRGGRATVLVEPPALPLPSAQVDTRRAAVAAALDELDRVGVPEERVTLLVANGLALRPGRRELEWLLPPARARDFRGQVEVHDCEDERLVELGEADGVRMRAAPALVETDVVVPVTAAETVLHGGTAALLAGGGSDALRAADAVSLLETTGRGWQLGIAFERALARRVPLVGAALVLNHPRLTGSYRGYPFERGSYGVVARSVRRRVLNLLPGVARRAWLQSLSREVTAVAAFGGPPSVAHAEALLRGIELRGTRLEQRLDAIVVPIPWEGPHAPRERQNPVTAAATGLALALRLWRNAFPVVDGGTAVLVHRLSRRFTHATRPYGDLLAAARDGDLTAAEAEAARDAKAIRAYREGHACHPLLPYRDWDACRHAVARLGAVVVAGARDAQAARALGFVPTHGMGPALTMAYGRAPEHPRVGFLVGPPYPPLLVGRGE
jgi:Lactate racemase N-terminal domain